MEKLSVVQEAKLIQAQCEASECIKIVIEGANKVVAIYQAHKAAVEAKIKDQDFADVDGQDFNKWGHDQVDDLEDIFWSLKMRVGNLEYDKKGFSVIEI